MTSDPFSDLLQIRQGAERQCGQTLAFVQPLIASGNRRDQQRAKLELQHCVKELRAAKTQMQQVVRAFSVNAREQRGEINKRGRTVATIMGRGTFGSALRGGLERGRERQRTSLMDQQKQLKSTQETYSLELDRMILSLEHRKLDCL